MITLLKDSIVHWEDNGSSETRWFGSVETEDEGRFIWQFEADNFASECTSEDVGNAGIGKRPLTIWSDADSRKIHEEFARRNG